MVKVITLTWVCVVKKKCLWFLIVSSVPLFGPTRHTRGNKYFVVQGSKPCLICHDYENETVCVACRYMCWSVLTLMNFCSAWVKCLNVSCSLPVLLRWDISQLPKADDSVWNDFIVVVHLCMHSDCSTLLFIYGLICLWLWEKSRWHNVRFCPFVKSEG